MIEQQEQSLSSGCKTWYALRTFNRQEQKVSLFLEEQHLSHFIPMAYSTRIPRRKEEDEANAENVERIRKYLAVNGAK